MILTEQEAVHYLLKNNLIDPQIIVEEDISIVDSSRRNRVFKVICPQGPSYLLKQGINPDGITTVAHEANFYRFLQDEIESNKLHHYLPRFYQYDPQDNILVSELLLDAFNLREYHAHRGRFSITHARTMGKALGTLHSLPPFVQGRDGRSFGLSRTLPWALFLHRPDLGFLHKISSANIQLIKILQQFPEFDELFNKLCLDWRADAIIHSDIKLDNCIVFTQSPSGRKTRLKIIDWEMASVGDPCWDVGSVFSDYLSYWLLSIPMIGEKPSEHFVDLARYPLERMQPVIKAFWYSYVMQMKLDTSASCQWLLRAVKYGAARLVQTAFESMQTSMQLAGNIICFLQISLNIFKRPQEASSQLLGIPLRE